MATTDVTGKGEHTRSRVRSWLRIAGLALALSVGFGAITPANASTLQVRRVSPSGANVQPGQEVVIQFDRKMVALGNMARNDATLPVSISPDPGCQWRWLNTSELACRLPKQQTFVPATHYAVTIGTALKALDGSHLPHALTRTFTTWLPKVNHAFFFGWDSPVTPVFRVRLNMPVTARQLAAHVGFVGSDDAWVPAKVEPFTKKRQGPVLLPVPGVPGAVLEVGNPQPDTPLDVHASEAAGRRIWLVRPAQPLAAARDYQLRIKPGMHSPLGALGGDQDEKLADLTTYGDFAFRGIGCNEGHVHVQPGEVTPPRCGPQGVNLLFSAPVPRATLAAIQWTPTPLPKGELARQWRDYPSWRFGTRNGPRDALKPDAYPLTFAPDPMQTFTLTVPAGVKDAFGRTLAKPVKVTLRTGHRQPFFDPPPVESVLETDQPTIVPLRFTNLSGLSFSHRELFAGNLRNGFPPAPATTTDLLQRPDLKAPADAIVAGNLGIRDLLHGRSGVVWGTLDWAPDGPGEPRQFLGEVTPYQVLAKVGHYDTLVWVGHLDNSTPAAGARVSFLHGRDHALDALDRIGTSVRTDAQGLAVLPGTKDLPDAWFNQSRDKSNFYVGVTGGDHMALLPLDWHFDRSVGTASHYDFWSDTAPPHGHMRAWAVTEQGIYRPGSDVTYAAFVRAEGPTTLEAPPALDYTLTIVDPQGNTILKREHVKLAAFGGTHGSLHIPSTAPMGRYDIRISWPTTTYTVTREAGHFLVTDFVPASFKVDTLVAGKHFGPGDKVPVKVHATLHAGGPYADAKVKFTTRLVPTPFAPDTPVASGFSFGDETPLPDARTIAQSDGKLDHAGRASTTVTLPTAGKVIHGDVTVQAAVESARATWVADTARVPYVARDRFVGLRTSNWMQTAGEPFKVEYLVVDPTGQPQAGSRVTLDLERRDITRVRVKNGAGAFPYEQHTSWVREDQCTAVSTDVPGNCSLTAKQAGSYRVVATVTDSKGRTQRSVLSTWVTGVGHVVWSRHGKGVTLVPDKATYHPGDVAHVLVQNPYPGAKALVTVERYGVLWKKVVTLSGSAPVIDVPIKDDFFPGAYLSVAIFSPRVSPPSNTDLGQPQLALGYVALEVAGKGSSLDVKVTPAKATYKPGQKVAVDVAVDRNGKPAGPTRLVVAVVDQGVLDLLADGTGYYDPRAHFYASSNGPDVSNYSLAEQLLTRLQPKAGKGSNPGGGGGASVGPNVRSNFKYSAYWNADITTDASGHAHFSFTVPDNLTRWRILVVAMRPGAAMGLGDGGVRVNLPLQIQPALPNQMHVGDRFGAGFNVTNRTQQALDVSTRISASGPIEGSKAVASDTLHLGSFAHDLAWLDLAADAPGDITLTASATSGELGDAVRAHIPVTSAGTKVVAAEYGSITGAGASVPVKVPANAAPHDAKVDVTFAPTLVGGLDGAFRVLRDDPLQTWEVRLSRGVLASDYQRLKPVIGAAFTWPDAQKSIDTVVKSAAAFQAPNGGMAFWIPRNKFVSPYLSVYTALAFDWLSDAGHTPPQQARAKLWQYLNEEILEKGADKPAMDVLRSGALAALAMAPDGKIPSGAVAGMLPKLPKLRLFGQALLLDAAVASGDRTSADVILKSLFSYAEESAGEISFNELEQGVYVELLATPLRSNCAILDAMSRYKLAWGTENLLGSTPQKLMRWITAQRRNAGGWPNSQENVFCTSAITHYADAYETPVKALTGTLDVADAKPQSATFDSRAAPAVKLEGPVAKPGQQGTVKLSRMGTGRLYYSVQLHYTMPPDALPAADAGMTLARHYFVQRDGTWQPVTSETVLQRGDIVRVDLDVDAPTERHHVVLSDPLPGTFEAVNRLLATAPKTTPARQPGVSILMFDGGAWPNLSVVTGGFYHRESHFDAVRFFADDLPAGHYRVVYAAQVIAPGKFIAPAPTVKEIYQPDVFGRGTPQHLNVSMPGQ